MHSSDFGKQFIWGTASSAFQTEGAYISDGKSLSIWDVFCEKHPSHQAVFNSKIATNFYNHYIQDLILMDYMNIRNFNFSLAWSRILPDGYGYKNQQAIDHYNRVIDYCLECKIQPWLTLYHWDLPQVLEEKGGWSNRDILNWFTELTEICCRHFGDRVRNWIVLHDPSNCIEQGYLTANHAPGKKSMSHFLPSVHHAAMCQSLGGRVIRSLQPDAQISTILSISPPFNGSHHKIGIDINKRMDALYNRLFLDPLLDYGYPFEALPFLQQMEKHILPGDEKVLPFRMDKLHILPCRRQLLRHNRLIPFSNAWIERGMITHHKSKDQLAETDADNVYQSIKYLMKYKQIPELIVIDKGIARYEKPVNGEVQDYERICHLENIMDQVLKAKKEGAPVNGFFNQHFTDCYDWNNGFNVRSGIVHIDCLTQKRTIKQSGYWYRNFLSSIPNRINKVAV